MKTKEITFENDEETWRVVVSEATALIGIKRTRMRVDGSREEDPDRRLLRMFSWADTQAATVETEGLPSPLTFEYFCLLPDLFVSVWESAVYDLNPHWVPKPDEEEESPKAISSTSD